MSLLFDRREGYGDCSVASVKEVGYYSFLTLSQDEVHVLGQQRDIRW